MSEQVIEGQRGCRVARRIRLRRRPEQHVFLLRVPSQRRVARGAERPRDAQTHRRGSPVVDSPAFHAAACFQNPTLVRLP
jgi:hypothetical protein